MSSNIRMRMAPDESMASEIKPFVRMFLSGCHGVILRKRGPDDNHVMFDLIAEDDEYWFPYESNGGSSSFWIDSLLDCLQAARSWCERKCDKDVCGWRFKDGTNNMKMVRRHNGALHPVPDKGFV